MDQLWIEPAVDDGTIGLLTGPGWPIAFTKHEGGNWNAVGSARKVKAPAAVLFDDGSIFDLILNSMGHHPWRRIEGRPIIRIAAVSSAQ
jgi:hypothetical protein